LCIWDNSPKEAVITDLYTVEVCRQQGFASELLSFCESFAKLQGCDSISLRSDKDDFVRKWYRKQGFEVESSEVWLRKKI
jgi:ribosomal protein S18 acetylase RimI-like enzyme